MHQYINASIHQCDSHTTSGIFIAKQGNAYVENDSVFEGNVATKGGAGYVEYGSVFWLTSSVLRNNVAVYDGGGLYINDAKGLLFQSSIEGNMAVDEGGGVNVQNGGKMTAIDTLFVQNTVGGAEETGSGLGGAVVLGRSTSGSALN